MFVMCYNVGKVLHVPSSICGARGKMDNNRV